MEQSDLYLTGGQLINIIEEQFDRKILKLKEVELNGDIEVLKKPDNLILEVVFEIDKDDSEEVTDNEHGK